MHIVLLILKILGIVLLCIVLLVLLILAALLFSAFRYEVKAEGNKDGPEVHANVRVRWLLGLVSVRALFDTPSDLGVTAKLFGIPVFRMKPKKNAAENPSKDEEKKEKDGDDKAAETKPECDDGKAADAKKDEKQDGASDSIEDSGKKDNAGDEKEAAKETAESADEKTESEKTDDAKDNAATDDGKAEAESDSKEDSLSDEAAEALDKPKQSLKEKISGKYKAIREKVSSLMDSLRAMLHLFRKKKGLLVQYAKKKYVKTAIISTWDRLYWILRHLAPKKYKGNVAFGMEDPALTGEIFAAISPVYFYFNDYLTLMPVFENKLSVGGDIYLKGRIRLFGILLRAWKVYRDKNVRKVIRDSKEVKELLTKTPDEVKECFKPAA